MLRFGSGCQHSDTEKPGMCRALRCCEACCLSAAIGTYAVCTISGQTVCTDVISTIGSLAVCTDAISTIGSEAVCTNVVSTIGGLAVGTDAISTIGSEAVCTNVVSTIGGLAVGADAISTVSSYADRADVGVLGAAFGNDRGVRQVAGSHGWQCESARSQNREGEAENQFGSFHEGVSSLGRVSCHPGMEAMLRAGGLLRS